MKRTKEQVIIEVIYEISYHEGERDEAIRKAEQVPLGIHGTDSSVKMLHGDKRRGAARGKIKSKLTPDHTHL
jgi:hypothetical protein